LAYGIESGSQKILDLMKKNFKIKDAQRVLQDTYEAGIYATANFMFGFPGETEEDFNCTLDFLHNNKAFISTLNPSLACTAIGVGTYLYEHAEEYGVDLNKGHLFWSSYDGGNTYEKRKARYLTFCKLASSLGIKLSYTIDLATQ
jgi:radical SAM superfamily enzyme YgiQ (UPF0313 family)